MLPQIFSRLIFKKLLMKLAIEVTFTFNNKFCKQINGCTMGGHLSVTLSDMVKMKIDVFRPLKPFFYSRYVNDIYNRRRKDDFDEVFHALNNYRENVKLTIEISPSKFLDTQLINAEENILQSFTERKAKY